MPHKKDLNTQGLAQDREKLRQTARRGRVLPIPGTKANTDRIKRSQMLKKRIKDRKTAARLRKRNASRGGRRH